MLNQLICILCFKLDILCTTTTINLNASNKKFRASKRNIFSIIRTKTTHIMKTTFKITSLVASFTLLCISCTNAQTYIPADDAKIQYTGRIDYTNSLQPQYSYPGVSIKAKFNGTGVSAIIQDHGAGASGTTNYYKVFIDGVIVTEQLKMDTGNKTYSLAAGLSAGDHTVEIMKITEGASGKSSFIGFEIKGGAQTSLDLPARAAKRLEFIGDSWTCGYGNLSQFASGSASMANAGYVAENEDNYYAWGPISARALGAEYQVTAISGRGLYRNNWQSDNTGLATGTLPKNYNNIMQDNDAIPYDHSFHPDVVSIHLGTNDMAAEGEVGESAKLDDAAYQNTYRDFIVKILTEHPCAKVVMCYGNSKSDGYPSWTKQLTRLRTITNNLAAMYPDGNVVGLELPYTAESWPAQSDDCGYGDAWHPSKCSHEEMSAVLVTKINSLTVSWGTTSGCTYTYNPGTAVGTAEIANSNTISIYPNPAQNNIVVQGLENNDWRIINQLGEVVLSGDKKTIDIEPLSTGVYCLLSTKNNQFQSVKFIKN
ncbi:MAG: lysophospholipase L1-like esterase [Glaciecola sp.]|jgi:lysophospholipase L1-like esterase